MAYKNWNWKHKKRPQFTYDKEVLKNFELEFAKLTGTVLGILKHVNEQEKEDMLPLVKAGISHSYFVCIHPFEGGNGRAITEKAIALSTGKPSLISLSQTIQSAKKNYYDSLETYNTQLDITGWLVYFGETIIQSQKNTMKQLDFLIEKTKFFDKHSPS